MQRLVAHVRDPQPRVTAVINAGGRSERMAASGIALHKALVPVRGVPLVERNLCVLLDQGFRDVVIVVSVKTPEVEEFVLRRLLSLAGTRGAAVECVREGESLGNFGIAGRLAARAPDLLMTFVDNLTTLDLQQVVAFHRRSQSAMTIASHVETFQVPHGELRTDGDLVVDYVEKPRKPVQVASGIYVVQSRAAAIIPPDRPTGAVDLVRLLKDRGEKISAFEHTAPWVDVNDEAAVRRAERLVAENADVFERRSPAPATVVECTLIRSASRFLVADRTGGTRSFRGRWDVIRSTDAAVTGVDVEAIINGPVTRTPLGSFDDFEDQGGNAVRHDLFLIEATHAGPSNVPDGFAWISAGSDDRAELTQPLRRCLAIAERFS